MTTKIKVTLEEFTGYPVEVMVLGYTAHGKHVTSAGVLHKVGDSVEVHVHQNQDVIAGEIKTNQA